MELSKRTIVGGLLFACGCSGEAASSNDVPESVVARRPFTVLACIDAPAAPSADPSVVGPEGPADLVFEGSVEATGTGLPGPVSSIDCPFSLRPFAFGGVSSDDVDLLAQLSWLRIRDTDGNMSLIAVLVPGFSFVGTEGEAVSVRFHTEPQFFSPVQNWMELRRPDGSLLFWLSRAGSVADLLGADEIRRETGRVTATRGNQCISSWHEYDLDVTFGDERASIGTEQRVTVGSLAVTNGGVELQNAGSTGCPDAYVASAIAAAWPVELSVSRSSGIGGWCDPTLTEEARFGSFYADKDFTCLSESPGSAASLSQPCQADADCIPGAQCNEALCRAACESGARCPPPSTCQGEASARFCR